MQDAPETTLTPTEYNERLIHPGASVGFFGWLALLGLPLLILFLIYSKTEERAALNAAPTAVIQMHPQAAQ